MAGPTSNAARPITARILREIMPYLETAKAVRLCVNCDGLPGAGAGRAPRPADMPVPWCRADALARFQQGGCRRCARCRYVIDRSRSLESSPPVDFLALGDLTAKAMSALGAKGQNPYVHPIKKPESRNPNCST